jgi:two-component system, OmpR family, sensor histidine kinase MtrB
MGRTAVDQGGTAGASRDRAPAQVPSAAATSKTRSRFEWLHRERQIRLRARVTTTFALGALVLSASLATMTYLTARQYLLREREDAVQRQAFVNAALIRSGLTPAGTNVNQLLESLGTGPTSRSVLLYQGRWYVSSIDVGPGSLPQGLRTEVANGAAAVQNFDLAGVPQVAVGVPVPQVQANYFEVFSLDELQRTLRILALSLAAAALVTTLLGAVVGRWASHRALRPLGEVAKAAAGIAGGNLDTRLASTADADLAVLVSSFNQMADSLQVRIEREARFTSDVSHELRTPLTTLLTSLEVLQARRDGLPERSRRALDLLAEDLHRFQKMVTDLLEISRFDAGAAELSLDEVAVGELVSNAITLTSQPDLPVHMGRPVADLRVNVDKRRIERIVANLVDNASVYAGGAIALTVESSNGNVRLVVDDAGPGIPEEERERVFERFARGAVGRHRVGHEGAGLGLSLVSEHVRLHGGRVWVEGRPAGGARFVVELPSVQTEPPGARGRGSP